jgi:hypothetical protein
MRSEEMMDALSKLLFVAGGVIFAIGMLARRFAEPELLERFGGRGVIWVMYLIGGGLMAVGYLLAQRVKARAESSIPTDGPG